MQANINKRYKGNATKYKCERRKRRNRRWAAGTLTSLKWMRMRGQTERLRCWMKWWIKKGKVGGTGGLRAGDRWAEVRYSEREDWEVAGEKRQTRRMGRETGKSRGRRKDWWGLRWRSNRSHKIIHQAPKLSPLQSMWRTPRRQTGQRAILTVVQDKAPIQTCLTTSQKFHLLNSTS